MVTYELCQSCGGQRPAGLPQVTSSLSEIKVNLQVQGVSGYNSDQNDDFPQTARLRDEDHSSGKSSGADTAGLEEEVSQDVIEMLNMLYMQKIGGDPRVWEWIAQNRARKI